MSNRENIGGLEILLDVVGSGMNPSAAIEAQEAREQSRMINRSQLPKDFKIWNDPLFEGKSAQEIYAWLGIEIEGEADDLFFNAKLPAGWTIRPTDHSMWSDVLDEKGRKRLGIFYKGAFYDRKAHTNLVSRFHHREVGFNDGKDPAQWVPYEKERLMPHYGVVTMDDKEIFRTGPHTAASESWSDQDTRKKTVTAECLDWLNKNYPNWADRKAMWDY